MYDRPVNRAAHDALWALIRDGLRHRGIAAPDALDRRTSHQRGWERPDLVLGQICNLPLRRLFWNKVTIIGASDYGLGHCPPGHYRSHFIAHRDADPAIIQDRSLRFAVNERWSWSGYGAPQAWAQCTSGPFTTIIETGSHDASLAMVAAQKADLAAIDAQTWRQQCQDTPATRTVKIIGHTASSPGQTFITRLGEDPEPYRAAVSEAIATLEPQFREVLGLRAITVLPENAYDQPMPPNLWAT